MCGLVASRGGQSPVDVIQRGFVCKGWREREKEG